MAIIDNHSQRSNGWLGMKDILIVLCSGAVDHLHKAVLRKCR